MNSETEELLKEYETWKQRKAFSGMVPDSPAMFIQERRTERALDALTSHLQDDAGDRYPIEEYLGEEDIDWLKTRKAVALPVDGSQ
jgi:hypothetical protein